MDVKELFSGVAVVIDDEINDGDANISNILMQIKNQNIPVLPFTSLPSEDILSNFHNLSFLLLDWRLVKDEFSEKDLMDGVRLPAVWSEDQANENIEFLNKLLDVCFCPVFIFSNEHQDLIIAKLESAGIYSNDKPNHIFVKSKSDLIGRTKLFKEVDTWVKKNPSIYVLKTWEKEYHQSNNQLFADFQKLSPMWPKIMWKTFGDDGANKSLELGELISRNLFTRMTPFKFSDDVLGKRGNKIEDADIKRVLEGERFLKKENIHAEDISTGDLFKEEYEADNTTKYRYYLNIRAQCDLIRSSDINKIELYCLKGRVIPTNTINKKDGITFRSGQFLERINHAVIPFLDNGMIIEFLFRDLIIKKWEVLKNKRIGRLLPPYINKVQQRYSLYLQRQGLPRIPEII
jgi:hypothetical protein